MFYDSLETTSNLWALLQLDYEYTKDYCKEVCQSQGILQRTLWEIWVRDTYSAKCISISLAPASLLPSWINKEMLIL